MDARAGMTARAACLMVGLWVLPVVLLPTVVRAQELPDDSLRPRVELLAADPLSLPGKVDSNSPALWALGEGLLRLKVFTSTAGVPSVSDGLRIRRMGPAEPITIINPPGHGVWFEAVVADEQDVWYALYHNEIPSERCERLDRTQPQVGLMRSEDQGATWTNLGILLRAHPERVACGTGNAYFVGGIGDISAVLNEDRTDLYIFFSQYSPKPSGQGVSVARLPWAHRDDPIGRVDVWVDGIWQRPEVLEDPGSDDPDGDAAIAPTFVSPEGTALFPTERPWHDDDPGGDAFWGPSVHWNTHLEQWVMLLNRTLDDDWSQDGVYVSFSPTLDDPTQWTPPARILEGGPWYPQVIGLEPGEGTDTRAAEIARLFVGGRSSYLLRFVRPGEP